MPQQLAPDVKIEEIERGRLPEGVWAAVPFA